MSLSLPEFLDELDNGVMLAGTDGRIRFANRAAKRISGIEPGKELPWAAARRNLEALAKGYAKPPVRLEVEDGDRDADRISLVLADGLSANTYTILMRNESDAQAYRNITANLYEFLRTELREPVNDLSQAVTLVMQALPRHVQDSGLAERLGEAMASGTELRMRLDKLVTLADAFSRDRLHADERIPVGELLEAAWNEVYPLAERGDVKVSRVGVDDELPPIYGSLAWLQRALAELLENAIRHSARKSHVEIEAHQTSQYVVVTVRNHGQSPIRMRPGRVFLPFASSLANPAREPGRKPGLGVGLAVAHRILELHGGNLRLGDADDESIAFVMELPTGAPKAQNETLELAQAQRYALDMAALIARQHGARASAGTK